MNNKILKSNPLKSFSKNANLYLLAISFYYISMGAFSMLHGIYMKELGINEAFLGKILFFRTISIAIFSIPCAALVNKIGKKKGIFLSLLLVPITIILMGFAQNKWAILIFSILNGGFQSFILVSDGPFLMENSIINNRVKLFSYAFADNVFSSMLGYFVFGNVSAFITPSFGTINALKYSIVFCGILGLVGCFVSLSIKDLKSVEINKHGNFLKDFIFICKKPIPLKFLFYNLLIGFGAGLVVPYFNIYLKNKLNASTSQVGVIMSLAQIATGCGGLITPYMAAKFGKVKTIIICQVVSIPFLMLIALPPNIIVVSAALFIRNGLMNMAGPVIGNLSMELIKEEERSIFASINSISNNIARALSSLIAGQIMSSFTHGYEIPYVITAVIYLFATIFFYKSFIKYNDKPVKLKTCQ